MNSIPPSPAEPRSAPPRRWLLTVAATVEGAWLLFLCWLATR
ncbi:MAG: hypothetical protein ACKOCW_13135 [Planctomycetaceae bacterium]